MSFISFILLLILQKTLSQSLSINNYILKDPFPLNLSISNHTINYNCLTFEAFHSEEQEPYEEYEDTYENPVISNLKITILLADESIFDIKITDEHEKRFEIPSKVPFPKDSTLQYSCKSIEKAINKRDPKLPPSDFTIFLTKKNGEIELDNPSLLYKVKLIDNPFGIQIMRKSTGEFIYNTADCNFIYHDKYLEFQNKINTDFIMGFGERNFKSRLDIGGIYTTWSRDEPNEIEDGWPPGKNSYGFHPIYLRKEQSGKFDIGFLRSSHAFDMILLNDSIKIISVFYFFHDWTK